MKISSTMISKYLNNPILFLQQYSKKEFKQKSKQQIIGNESEEYLLNYLKKEKNKNIYEFLSNGIYSSVYMTVSPDSVVINHEEK